MNLLPQFPLKLVVFPGEDLNLHIFEDRYKQLIHDCFQQKKAFGIPSVMGEEAYKLGTTVKVIEIAKTYADGKMDVKTKGLEVYKLLSFENPMPGKLYAGGRVQMLKTVDDSDEQLNQQIIEHIKHLYTIMKVQQTAELNSKTFRTSLLAHKIGLSYKQELYLRSCLLESEKQKYVLDHLELFIPQVMKIEDMRTKIQMNGHFKDLKSYDLGERSE